ncbi:MAG: YeeE/YedE family protein [Gammaproteobacteria bacterium]|nr:YeeE/YedE family protein [Gammaproteobacteria bacterium]MBK8133762.1 YeeE/YedE family protein [Gammaproteobacteria bacterium]
MHPFLLATIGGGLVGVAAVMMMALNGRIAGVSGILTGVFTQRAGERVWRLLFVLGIVLGGSLPPLLNADFKAPLPGTGLLLAVIGGLLVGFGTGLGSGCTSGHGICGIARFSKRSLLATIIFMTAGVITVAILRLTTGS